MQVKTIISALAVSLTMAVSGPVFAQTMVNGMEVSADDLPAVQARCTELMTSEDASSISDQSTSNGSGGESAASADATTTNTPQVNETTQATTKFDLDTLDAESCATLMAK